MAGNIGDGARRRLASALIAPPLPRSARVFADHLLIQQIPRQAFPIDVHVPNPPVMAIIQISVCCLLTIRCR